MHDAFEWWSLIWIPLMVGSATVLVAAVALIASARATTLAHAVERERDAAEVARSDEQRRLRVQDMAIDEARALQRWVVETQGLRNRWIRPGEPNLGRSEAEQSRVDAEVALTQSIVPGADALLELTQFDLTNRYAYVAYIQNATDEQNAIRERIIEARMERTSERIRLWALDPEQRAPLIAGELHMAEDDRLGYLMFGEAPLTEE